MIKAKSTIEDKRSSFSGLNNSGQALVEYLLVLIVTVSIIIGLVAQFNRSIGDWVGSYFGEYIACILETGEMPKLQGEDGADQSICEQAYEPFSLASGRPPKEGGEGDDKNESSSSSAKRFRDGGGGRGSKKRGSRGGRSGSDRGSPFLASNSSGGSDSDSDGSSKSAEDENTGDTGVTNYGNLRNQSKSDGDRRIYRSKIRMSSTELDDKKKNNGKPKVIAKVKVKEQAEKNQRFIAASKLKKSKTTEIDTTVSFGDYIRYLVIAIIIILMLIVLLGQGYQVKKSMD